MATFACRQIFDMNYYKNMFSISGPAEIPNKCEMDSFCNFMSEIKINVHACTDKFKVSKKMFNVDLLIKVSININFNLYSENTI